MAEMAFNQSWIAPPWPIAMAADLSHNGDDDAAAHDDCDGDGDAGSDDDDEDAAADDDGDDDDGDGDDSFTSQGNKELLPAFLCASPFAEGVG